MAERHGGSRRTGAQVIRTPAGPETLHSFQPGGRRAALPAALARCTVDRSGPLRWIWFWFRFCTADDRRRAAGRARVPRG